MLLPQCEDYSYTQTFRRALSVNRQLCGITTELRSCVKVEEAILGSPSLIVRTVSVDVLGSPSLIVRTVSVDVLGSLSLIVGRVSVDVLGSPSLIVRTVSVDVKQQ